MYDLCDLDITLTNLQAHSKCQIFQIPNLQIQIFKSPNSQISKSSNLQIFKSPNQLQILPKSQISKFQMSIFGTKDLQIFKGFVLNSAFPSSRLVMQRMRCCSAFIQRDEQSHRLQLFQQFWEQPALGCSNDDLIERGKVGVLQNHPHKNLIWGVIFPEDKLFVLIKQFFAFLW